ncbi:hypothetical protein SH591_08830 [Sphingomonas sp. LY54]|uniref:hypothetical protein n=1 Tax=Sphingomonas sp. LY54 TaxID=3095343 RepID=UPI002D7A2438|nr:hypothetical protein [Sphingomonas sp. LY54]WRP27228.1 hypothetical protein SH591_08830 [Sphingomonas sp. LY54]
MAEADERRNEGLCPWRLADPDENGHVELQYECGGQKVAVNLGRIEPVLDAFLDFTERHQWRD